MANHLGVTDLMAVAEEMAETLYRIDYTLNVHGHVDADTPLHKKVSKAIEHYEASK